MSTPYHIGFYALVQHHGTYLVVRQATSTLPSGPYGLPGAALVGEVGGGVAELHLRRKLLSQMGLSVGELVLVGSHTLRLTDGGVVLNLIFGTTYNSGVPNPQAGIIQAMNWISLDELAAGGDAPDWLMTAIRTYQEQMAARASTQQQGRGILRWGR
ncbi:hypothetical protein [Deinococcus aquiradiocola]|uniref:NUDIX hydrolase n=1 Tax=Deinococcus aquiradiocola TaxID=393059 RepID=A0A917UU74_9DEIO|nr:hypothetical protein [Deinococcus aquiradiocola]GGJ85845.1 hypothetical protein GCM10008939_32160 [Deinococcus aquiradiocola]